MADATLDTGMVRVTVGKPTLIVLQLICVRWITARPQDVIPSMSLISAFLLTICASTPHVHGMLRVVVIIEGKGVT